MSFEPDVIVDRRRIRRKLTFWRVSAVLAVIVAIVAVALAATPAGRDALTGKAAVARINLDGAPSPDLMRTIEQGNRDILSLRLVKI